MGKIRIYELAKKLKTSNSELIEVVKGLGIEVKSHMSAVDETSAKAIAKAVASPPAPVKKAAVKKKKEAKETKPPKAAKAAKPKKAAKETDKAKTAKTAKAPKIAEEPKAAREGKEKKKTGETIKAKASKEPKKAKEAGTAKESKAKKEVKEVKEKKETKDQVPPSPRKKKEKAAEKKGVKKKAPEPEPPVEEKPEDRIVKISEGVTVKDLSERLGVKVNEIITRLMKKGKMVVVNQFLDSDTAKALVEEMGFLYQEVSLEDEDQPEDTVETAFTPRSPVVTIMGHVDHGKTSLLDAIRETSVADREKGGITQHIGAYHVELPKGSIVFLDTPGHEAFTAMRSRGAEVTDIVILVVAADDGVMPQTIEALDHAKAAEVPILVAVNKIDKPDSKPENVKTQLSEHGLISEEWGGDTIFIDVSAKKRIGLENLMEMILLQAEIMELKANPAKPCIGTVVESKLDRGRGPVATVLVQDGTLRTGDYFVTGTNYGKVRAIIDENGKTVREAPPSTPVEVLGISGVPSPGDSFKVVSDERKARQVVALRQQKSSAPAAKASRMSLKDLFSKVAEGAVKELHLVVKGDVQGSVEAVCDSLKKLSTEKVKVNVIHRGVGTVNEGDILLAAASNAVIIGFNVRPEPKVTALATREGVDMRFYTIIYQVTEDVKQAMLGKLDPTLREEYQGRAEVRDTFSVPKVGVIAGCGVLDGKITRNAEVRVLRDGVVIYEGKISSLRRFKDDVKEVATGYECGAGVSNFNDIKKGDILETFVQVEVKPSLE